MRIFSGYCFYMNTSIQGDFQISISVPISNFFIKIYSFINISDLSYKTMYCSQRRM